MKKMAILILLFLILTGCKSKYYGTWCKYVQTYSVYGIVKVEISDKEKNEIIKFIKNLDNLKSYDYLDDIDDAKGMFVIYLSNNDDIDIIKTKLKDFAIIYEAGIKDIESVNEELIINKNGTLEYNYNLTEPSSNTITSKFTIEDYMIKLDDHDLKFYLKDDFICKEFTCETIYIKSSGKTCN